VVVSSSLALSASCCTSPGDGGLSVVGYGRVSRTKEGNNIECAAEVELALVDSGPSSNGLGHHSIKCRDHPCCWQRMAKFRL